jgi:hypothetical protein
MNSALSPHWARLFKVRVQLPATLAAKTMLRLKELCAATP